MGLLLPSSRIFLFLLLNAVRFPPAHFSSPSKSLRMPAQPSGASAASLNFVSPAGLLRVLCSSVEVISEDVKQCRTWHHPWGSPLLTGPQLHSVPLTAILSAWHFSQFSIHLTVPFSGLYFTSRSSYNLSALQWIGQEVKLQQETLILDKIKEFFKVLPSTGIGFARRL